MGVNWFVQWPDTITLTWPDTAGTPENAAPEHVPSIPYLPEDGGLPLHMLGTVRFD